MRGIILILILLVVAAIAAVATGFLNIDQTRGAEVPAVSVTDNGVVAKGGQPPAFDIDTGKVKLVPPKIEVTPRPDNEAAPAPAPGATQPQPQPQPPAQAAPATTDSTQR
jgi:hypothetical protein